MVALATDKQTLQQRGAVTHRTPLLGPRPVGGQPLDVLLVLLQRYVGREALFDESVPLPWVEHHAAGAGPPQPLSARIDLSLTVSVNSRVDGVFEHVLQGHPVGL